MEEDFKTASREFNDINAQLKEFKTAIKELNTRRKLLSKFITEYMSKNQKEVVKLGPADGKPGGRITLRKRMAPKPLTRNELTRILTLFFEGDGQRAEELAVYILEHRDKVERSSLFHRFERY